MVTFAAVVLWASLATDDPCSPLHKAARSNDVPRIRELLSGRMLGLIDGEGLADLDAPGVGQACSNRTPLMVAAEAGSTEAAAELLRRGAQPDAVADSELGPMSAWCYALLGRRGEGVAQLLFDDARAHPQSWGPEAVCVDNAKLIAAVREGTAEDVRAQLRASPSQVALVRALDESVGKRQLDAVRLGLLARITDLHNLRALQTAVWTGDTLALKQLADAGATVSNESALTWLSNHANDHTRAEILTQLLRMATLTTGQVSKLGWDALTHDDLETLEAMAPLRVRLRAIPEESPLAGREELAMWRHSDDTALSIAFGSREPARAVRALLGLGVELETPTAMSRAAALGDCEVAKALSDAGAPLNQVDSSCQTPLEVARAQGHWQLAKWLARAVKGHPRLANPAVRCADTVAADPSEPGGLWCDDE